MNNTIPHSRSAEYFADCNDFFAPLDEVAEALRNGEPCSGISKEELPLLVDSIPGMSERIAKYM